MFTGAIENLQRRVLVMGLGLLLGVNLYAANSPPIIQYRLQIDRSLSAVKTNICAISFELYEHQFQLPDGARWINRPQPNGPRNNLAHCLEYAQQLRRDNTPRYAPTAATNEYLLTDLQTLLACPKFASIPDREVSIIAPPEVTASFPGSYSERTISLAQRPCGWSSGVLIGALSTVTIMHTQAAIRVSMPRELSDRRGEKILAWLTAGLDALATAYGKLPLPEVQIIVIPTGPQREAVPWGQVTRGGGDSVHLYIDETKTLEELNNDWVLVHELSHLLHPYLSANDGWLAEGIASYYQNVLRARAGLLTAQQAWEKLDAGFRRGEKQFKHGMTLQHDTRKMMRDRQYMRVYWAGAAIALIADIHLRTMKNSDLSLDRLLEDICECCLPTAEKKWRAKDLFKRFDKINGTVIFSDLYREYVASGRFPAIADAYQLLGISRNSSGLIFDNESALWSQIMRESP